MAALRELRHYLIPTSDAEGRIASDGYLPKWLSDLIKENLLQWRVADDVSFGLHDPRSAVCRTPRTQVNFRVGRFFSDDTEREARFVEECIRQAVIVYGSVLSNPIHLGEYRARVDIRQALDYIVQDRSLLCFPTRDSMVLSQDVHRWLRKTRALQPGQAYLVQQR